MAGIIYPTNSVLPQLVKPTNYYTSDGSNDFHKPSSSLVLITVVVVCGGLLLILTALFIIAVICGYHKWRKQRTNIPDVSLAHRPRENSGIHSSTYILLSNFNYNVHRASSNW